MWLGALTQFSLLVGGTWWIFEEFCLDCIGFLLSLACYGLKVLVFSVFRVFSFLNACQFFKWLFGLDWDMDGPPNSEIFQDVFLLPVCRMCWIWMGYCIDSPTVFFSFICFLRFCFAFIFWDLDFSRCHVSGFFAVFWWCQDKFRWHIKEKRQRNKKPTEPAAVQLSIS